MNLVKTLVIGDSGSGKSWRSEQLATAFGSVWVDLDLLHWEPGGYNMPRKREDVIAMARDAAASERWGFEGIDGWIVSEIRSAATALVWIDLDESENVASTEWSIQFSPERSFANLVQIAGNRHVTMCGRR